MKKFFALALLGMLACSPDPVDKTKQFTLNQTQELACPKCGSQPDTLLYRSAQDSTGDGANDHEHFYVHCKQCGFQGWSTIQDARIAIQALRNH